MECKRLKSVTIPDSVTYLGSSVFTGCTTLESVKLSSSLNEIKSNLFSECKKLKSISIPSSVTKIGSSAFSGCGTIETITLPANVTEIESAAFSSCTSLKNISLPSGVTKIGDSAFCGCYFLQSIELPYSLTEIGRYAFANCYSLAEVTIPNSVESIGSYAFSDCKSLSKVTIPESVKSIGSGAFKGGPKGINETSSYYDSSTSHLFSGINESHYSRTSSASITRITTNSSMPVITTQELTIYCYEGSSAELYALDNDINYVLIKSGSDSSSGICGDVDGDGTITSADALEVLRFTLGMATAGKVGNAA